MSERGPQLLKSHSHLTATAPACCPQAACVSSLGDLITPQPPTMSDPALQRLQDPQSENQIIKQGRRWPRGEDEEDR